MIGLLYQTDEPLPFDIDRGLSDKEKRSCAEQAIALEWKRIREYVRAVCEEMEKSYENARTAFLYTLPEFIRFGTYNGEKLLSKRRDGYYEILPMYKSYRGRNKNSNTKMCTPISCA